MNQIFLPSQELKINDDFELISKVNGKVDKKMYDFVLIKFLLVLGSFVLCRVSDRSI